MPTVEIRHLEDSLVIHFGTDLPRVNAYTLASTLVAIADAAKAANATLNPGYEIEVVVEALGSGSFRATVRTIYREMENLFSANAARTVVLGVIANFIYAHTLAPDTQVTVNVGRDEVVIEHGDTRIVVPRGVHEALSQVEHGTEFRKGIADALRAAESDPSVRSIALCPPTEQRPPVEIPRARFPLITQELDNVGGPDTRELEEVTDVQITRAILAKSRRRWEFIWHGVRIAAPVLDDGFYARFFAHEITIAPGDMLRVRLRIRQRREPSAGVFVNECYEVTEVMDHIPRPRQAPLLP